MNSLEKIKKKALEENIPIISLGGKRQYQDFKS